MNGQNFSAINTKTRVLKSRLLSDQDYINLMQFDSVKEQIDYLKNNTVYGDLLADIDDSNYDIQNVEINLKRYLIVQMEKIIRYFTREYKEFYKTMLLRYEVEDLKLYLRALERKEEIPNVACFFLEHSTFNSKKLSKITDVGEFIDGLKGTIYYEILIPYKDEEGPKTTFYMEMNLDRLYFNQLKVKCQKLKKVDRKAFDNILGENVDLLNIEWIYRGIKFYNLIPEELINYLLPHGKEFKYKDLKDMCYSDIETLKTIVLNSKYSFLFDTKKDVELFMERRIERYFYFKFKSLLKKGHLNILTTIAYFHLLEFEIRDIISMLEAKRYGFTLDETVNYLVKKIEGSDY
ncbi:MAG: V-type ATPase subunit [Tissierellia bacterium]|nr:V-type ATPase subunit [Tissierellia bacterium]